MEYQTEQVQFQPCQADSLQVGDKLHQRRSANYRPNLWKYDFLQSLNNNYDLKEGIKERVERLVGEVKPMLSEEAVDSLHKLELIDSMRKLGLSNLFVTEIEEAVQTIASTNGGIFNVEDRLYASALRFRLLRQHGHVVSQEGNKERVEQLVEEVKPMLSEGVDSLAKLELIDSMRKLGLSNLFDNEMKEALETVASTTGGVFNMEDHLYASALRFRLFRQHGHVVSEDELRSFKEGRNTLNGSNCEDVEAIIELFEASHLALEGENILDEMKAFSTGILPERVSSLDGRLLKRAVHALELPMHWRVQWFDIKWQIELYEQQEDKQSNLLELAKLNFNTVQATHQRDLRDISRWWNDLGLIEHVAFARDRLVESFLCALGLSHEPRFSSLRKSLTKVIILILMIDDVYDLYGSLEELECFTGAITRWDSEQIQQLPDCMKVCFRALRDVTYNDITYDIGKDEDCHRVLPHLTKAWEDFCKALLNEAKWDNLGYTPSLEEYLSNAWTSSSGPLISSHAYYFMGHMKLDDAADLLQRNKDLIYNVSMVIRLCNDLGTSTAERDRGDAPSSVACYMREVNVSEDVARKHIKVLIKQAWKSINAHCFGNAETPFLRPFINVTVNAARVAHMLYQFGDGFGIQDGNIRRQILSTVIEPLALN